MRTTTQNRRRWPNKCDDGERTGGRRWRFTCGGSFGEAVGLHAVQRLGPAPAGSRPWAGLDQALLLHQRLLLPAQVFLLDEFSPGSFLFLADPVFLRLSPWGKSTTERPVLNTPPVSPTYFCDGECPTYLASSRFSSLSASSCCLRSRVSSALRCCLRRKAARRFAISSSAFSSSCKVQICLRFQKKSH